MSKPIIINVSGKARSGKDTFCDMLKKQLEENEYRVLKIAYADYLKFLCKSYFGWNGEKDDIGRKILQVVGTDKIREKSPNFWVNTVINLITVLQNDYDFILISDCRFPNESAIWKSKGFNEISVHIDRIGFENNLTAEQKNHSSETAMDNFAFDYYLEAENIEELQQRSENFAEYLFES